MAIKKCKDCGDKYNTKDQKVTLILNHKDIEAIEDVIFTTAEQTKSEKDRVQKFWKQLCDKEGKWKTARYFILLQNEQVKNN